MCLSPILSFKYLSKGQILLVMEKGRAYKDSESSFPKAGLAIMRPGQVQCLLVLNVSFPVSDSLIIYLFIHSLICSHMHSFTPPFISSFIH